MADVWIEKFKKEALPKLLQAFQPVKVWVFGSRIRGQARESSDIDVILVAKAFSGVPFVKRMGSALRIARFPKHVDFLCYAPDEFERVKNQSEILSDAMEYARRLH